MIDFAYPHIETARLRLRLPEPGDEAAIVAFYTANDKHFAPTDPPRPVGFFTEAYWQEKILAARREFVADQSVRLILFHNETKDQQAGRQTGQRSGVIGVVNFTQIFRGPWQACYLGYAIDEREQGKGLMTEALEAAIKFMFEEKRLHRIMANHLPENERSARVLKKLGFVQEGYAKDYLFIGGGWRDHVLTALVNHAWRPRA